jgi:hypothetical protein
MALVADDAAVTMNDHGLPESLSWNGDRYRVTDTPTPLDFDLDAVTHLSKIPTGWRFQGTNRAGQTLIFDVVSFDDHGQQWRILRTYI